MMRKPPLTQRRDAGLSLIELVVAMALFALVAVMGLQSLTGNMRATQRLTEIDTDTRALGDALSLMRNDMDAIVPMSFYAPSSPPRPAVDLSEDGRMLSLSLAGQPSMQTAHTDRQRAEWVFDPETGVLSRQVWPALLPRTQAQRTDAIVMLSGVTDLAVRSFWPGSGWNPGTTSPLTAQLAVTRVVEDQDSGPGGAPAAYVSVLPDAVEVTLRTTRYGDVRLVQALR